MNNLPWITIMLTSKCNNKCSHCYINFDGCWSIESAKNAINMLKKDYNIQLNGAEILTNPEYLSLYPLVNQRNLLTNGKALLENPKLIDLAISYGINQISLSYHYGIHNELSEIIAQDVEKIIDLLKTRGITILIMAMLNKDNYKLVPQICDYMYKLGVNKLQFMNYLCQGKKRTSVKYCQVKKYNLPSIEYQNAESYITKRNFILCVQVVSGAIPTVNAIFIVMLVMMVSLFCQTRKYIRAYLCVTKNIIWVC